MSPPVKKLHAWFKRPGRGVYFLDFRVFIYWFGDNWFYESGIPLFKRRITLLRKSWYWREEKVLDKSKKYFEERIFIQSKYKNSNVSFKKMLGKNTIMKGMFCSKSILNGFLWCGFKNLNSEFRISWQPKTSSDECIIWNKKF